MLLGEGGEEEVEEEAEVASPPCVNCWTFLQPWREAGRGPGSRSECLSEGFEWGSEPGRRPLP